MNVLSNRSKKHRELALVVDLVSTKKGLFDGAVFARGGKIHHRPIPIFVHHRIPIVVTSG